MGWNPQLFELKDHDGVVFGSPKSDSSGMVDVVNEYTWSVAGKGSIMRPKTPRVHLEEYQIVSGQLQMSAYYFLRGIKDIVSHIKDKDGVRDPYSGLYFAKKTGFSYSLPYLQSQNTVIGNSFAGDQDMISSINGITQASNMFPGMGFASKITQGLANFGSTISALGSQVLPGFGVESTKAWQGTSDRTTQFSFDLLNTISWRETKKNWEFVYLLVFQNLFWRQNIYLKYPPCIYSAFIPGIYSAPACYMESLTVENLGQSRVFKEDSGSIEVTFPEAYRITISLKELLPQSRNIHQGVLAGKGIDVISEVDSGDQANNATVDAFKGAKDTIVDNVKTVGNSIIDQTGLRNIGD